MQPLPNVSTALAAEIAALTVYYSNETERVGFVETEILIRSLHSSGGALFNSQFHGYLDSCKGTRSRHRICTKWYDAR
jgi:hypothetical protein